MTVRGFDDYATEASGARVIYDMSAKEYHSDADGPRLSQSLATTCVNQSPLHAWQKHPLLGLTPWSYVPSSDDGTIIHSLILEPEAQAFTEIDLASFLNKDGSVAKTMNNSGAKAAWAAAEADGKIPILAEKMGAFRYKAKALRQRLAEHPDFPITFDGDSEVVIYWTENTPSGPIRCRCRIDHLIVSHDRIRIIDLKSSESAHKRDLKGSCWRYGYDVQQAAYMRAVAAAFPEYVGRIDMLFAFVELEKPYAVNPIRLSGEFHRLGEARWERGRNQWAAGLKSDQWSGYESGTLEPPAWAAAEEMSE